MLTNYLLFIYFFFKKKVFKTLVSREDRLKRVKHKSSDPRIFSLLKIHCSLKKKKKKGILIMKNMNTFLLCGPHLFSVFSGIFYTVIC